MKDIAKLQVYESNLGALDEKDIDVFVMRLKKKGEDEKDMITTLTKQEKLEYKEFKKDILNVLNKFSNNKEQRITFLAPLIDDILQDRLDEQLSLKLVDKKEDE